jgi:hypothetical protein
MSNLSNPVPSVKPGRTVRVLERTAGLVLLEIRQGKKASRYWLTRIPSEVGPAFRFEKFEVHGGERYDVCLGTDPHEPPSCECKGHIRWGHRTTCRHLACLYALAAAGKLPS